MPIEVILNEFVNTQGGNIIPLSTNIGIALTHLATILCHIMVDINDFRSKLHSKKNSNLEVSLDFFFFFFLHMESKKTKNSYLLEPL